MKNISCKFGIEGGSLIEFKNEKISGFDHGELKELYKAIRKLGIDFVVCELWPESNDIKMLNSIKEVARIFYKNKLDFFINQEMNNYSKEGDILDDKGNDLLKTPDGCHSLPVAPWPSSHSHWMGGCRHSDRPSRNSCQQ